MKNIVSNYDWEEELEKLLARMLIPYHVSFDNHNGTIRKIITIEPIEIFPYWTE